MNKQGFGMKQVSTGILKSAVAAIALAALMVCLFVLPGFIVSELDGDFDYGYIMIGVYITAIPFFYALFNALKLLNYIDRNAAFTKHSVSSLQKIKLSGYIISAIYAAGLPYIFYLADKDDAPGVVAIGLVIVAASFVIATASGVFQQLVQNAVDIKSENDLTV